MEKFRRANNKDGGGRVVSSKFSRLGNGKLFLLLLGVMMLSAVLIALALYYPDITNFTQDPWIWRSDDL